MITNNPMQLKAVFKKRAAEAGVPALFHRQRRLSHFHDGGNRDENDHGHGRHGEGLPRS